MEQEFQSTQSDIQHHKKLLLSNSLALLAGCSRWRSWRKVRWTNTLVSLLAVSGAVLLWALALRGVDLSHMNDLGLVSVLPLWAYASLAILTISFALVVHRRQSPVWLPFVYVVVLILMIHGTPNILYGTLRYSWAWKHVGIVDYIQRHGSVNPNITYLNAYMNWPGFFALNAFITQIAGFQSALSYAGWAPVFFNLLDLGALVLILKTNTHDWRYIWLSIWFFYLANWVGQDYFSPQAMSYFLYLMIVGVCLRWFSVTKPPSKAGLKRWLVFDSLVAVFYNMVIYTIPEDAATPARPMQRVGLMVIIILIFIAVASSHQLTPFMVIAALSALVAFQRCNARALPLLVSVLAGAWISYMAVDFIKHGNIVTFIDSIGRLFSNFDSNFINLSHASSGQKFVALMSRGLTAYVGFLALLGGLRRLRLGYWDLSFILLILAPLPLIAGNSYGGEMLFRIYFFALPFLSFFAAANVYPLTTSGTSWRSVALTVLLSATLLVGFFFAYYGKERMYYFSKAEVAAADYLYNTAPDGSLIVDATVNYPWGFKNYEYYSYFSFAELSKADMANLLNDPAHVLAADMKNKNYTASYLIITRSQEANVEMLGLMPPGSLAKIEQALRQSRQFKLVYANKDAQIYTLTPGNNGAGQ